MKIRKGRRGLVGKVKDRPLPRRINPSCTRGLPARVVRDAPLILSGKNSEPYLRFRKKPEPVLHEDFELAMNRSLSYSLFGKNSEYVA